VPEPAARQNPCGDHRADFRHGVAGYVGPTDYRSGGRAGRPTIGVPIDLWQRSRLPAEIVWLGAAFRTHAAFAYRARILFVSKPYRDILRRCRNLASKDSYMPVERTLSIIKPDAVAKNVIGKIFSRFEQAGLKIVAVRMQHLSRPEAEGFYAVHVERPFFRDLVDFMVSGPVVIQVLEGEDAIQKNRELMGATDPKKAVKGTIRADFAQSIDANAVHGSDSLQTAATEIAYFFPALEIYSR
jgi:nucleoside-diphosphate kinase